MMEYSAYVGVCAKVAGASQRSQGPRSCKLAKMTNDQLSTCDDECDSGLTDQESRDLSYAEQHEEESIGQSDNSQSPLEARQLKKGINFQKQS